MKKAKHCDSSSRSISLKSWFPIGENPSNETLFVLLRRPPPGAPGGTCARHPPCAPFFTRTNPPVPDPARTSAATHLVPGTSPIPSTAAGCHHACMICACVVLVHANPLFALRQSPAAPGNGFCQWGVVLVWGSVGCTRATPCMSTSCTCKMSCFARTPSHMTQPTHHMQTPPAAEGHPG